MAHGAGALKMWIAGRAEANEWKKLAREAEIPLLQTPEEAEPNDCVIVAGLSRKGAVYPVRSGEAWDAKQFGKSAALPLSPWFMNAAGSELAKMDGQELEKRLRREGVSARIGEKVGMTLTVSVWGFEALEMLRGSNGDSMMYRRNHLLSTDGKMTITREHAFWKPAEKMAVRAIYALGLDFGQVEFRVSDQGRLAVISVDSRLVLHSLEAKQRWREAAEVFSTGWAAETASGTGVRAMLGADPEFVLLSRAGRVVPASRYFPYEGEAGCDSIRLRGEKIWPLVELRPRPCPEPTQLTAELHSLLREAAGRTAGAGLSWRAGALPVRGLPLGGHVHLSGAVLHGERLRALDNAVALPLRLLEPPSAGSRRPRYGALGDVRRQPHGGFEYRTPPSWLVSPRLTLGVFSLAKVAAEHSRELAASGRPLDEEQVREAFYAGDRETLLTAVRRVHTAIAWTAGYEAYREPIDFVFDAIERGKSWNEGADIRTKWHIPVR